MGVFSISIYDYGLTVHCPQKPHPTLFVFAIILYWMSIVLLFDRHLFYDDNSGNKQRIGRYQMNSEYCARGVSWLYLACQSLVNDIRIVLIVVRVRWAVLPFCRCIVRCRQIVCR